MESIKSDPQFQNLIRAQNCPILPTHSNQSDVGLTDEAVRDGE